MLSKQTADARRSHVYLLRLWREAEGAPWRLALRRAAGTTMIGFDDLDALVLFLLHQMSDQPDQADLCITTT